MNDLERMIVGGCDSQLIINLYKLLLRHRLLAINPDLYGEHDPYKALEYKIDIKIKKSANQTLVILVPIKCEGKDPVTITEIFIAQLSQLIKSERKRMRRKYGWVPEIDWEISSEAETIDKINEEQGAWSSHCERFWEACDHL